MTEAVAQPAGTATRSPLRGAAPLLLLLLGVLACAALATIDLPSGIYWPFTLARSYTLAWICYVAAAVLVTRSRAIPRWTVAWILLAAVAMHTAAYLHQLPMSSDHHRYLWDGRVINAGHNPYVYSPDSPALSYLHDANWHLVWYRRVYTLYPPLAELLFAGLARLRGADLVAFHWTFIAANLGSALLLIALLRRTGRPPEHVIWFAWNPLVITETASGGHVDCIGLFFLLLALLLAARREGQPGVASSVAYAAAVLSKGFALLAFPFFALRGRGRFLLPFALTVGLCFLPFARAGRQVFYGLGFYFSHWETNASFAYALRSLLDWVTGTDAGARSQAVITRDIVTVRVISAACLCAVIVWLVHCRRPGMAGLLSAAFTVLAAQLLLCAPVLPWYVTSTVPLLCWWPVWGWVLFTLTVFVQYYLRFALPDWYPVPLLLGYVPVYALLAWQGWRWRQRRQTRG